MPVKLYYLLASPPARAVKLTLLLLDIPHETVDVDLFAGEHKSEAFMKLNPQHTVPVIVDEDGFTVSDSHVIMSYLINKYAKDDKLYPKDTKARSVVDHRLYFDCGTLFQNIRNFVLAFRLEKTVTGMTPAFANRFNDAYESLERYLASTSYIAADHFTIADFSILTTLENAQFLVPIKEEKFPKLAAYIKRGCANIPELENLNKAAAESLKAIFGDFNPEDSVSKI